VEFDQFRERRFLTNKFIEIDNETAALIDLSAIGNLAAHHLTYLSIHPDARMSVTFIDSERMTTLHEDWMQEPGATDVLSFPIDEITLPATGLVSESGFLGDIVVCPEFLPPQMIESGRSLQQECEYLVTHGILHLLGLDHQEEEAHRFMFTLTDTLISDWHNQ
jgi:probable rRNA maturation factor